MEYQFHKPGEATKPRRGAWTEVEEVTTTSGAVLRASTAVQCYGATGNDSAAADVWCGLIQKVMTCSIAHSTAQTL
eukprot:jgi/Chrzof1/5157/Cz15g13190.t1